LSLLEKEVLERDAGSTSRGIYAQSGPLSLVRRLMFFFRASPRFAILYLVHRLAPSRFRLVLFRRTGNLLGMMTGRDSRVLTDFFHAAAFVNMQFGIPYEWDGFQVRSGMRVLDVGAHHGIYSVRAALSGAVEVLAVEPHPENFVFLLHNMAVNGLVNMIPINAAVSDKNGSTLLLESFYSGQHTIFPGLGDAGIKGSVRVDCLTLDSLVLRERFEPDLIKIDCEGAELLALQGATRTLGGPRAGRVVVEIHWNDPGPVVRFLKKYGYNVRTVMADKPMVFARKDA
jgi:FkbM family methyltransferase